MNLTPITYEEVLALIAATDKQIAENGRQMMAKSAEIDKQRAETEKELTEFRKETDKELAEFRKETDKELAEFRKETDKELAEFRKETEKELAEFRKETEKELTEFRKETEKELTEFRKETDKELAQAQKELAEARKETEKEMAILSKKIAALTEQVSGITDTLGRFAEEQIHPTLIALFREKGVELEEIYPRVDIKKDGKTLLEIDLLLVNTIYSVAVEVKHSLRQRDVDEHLKRLAKFRETSHRIIKGTTMYGAIAGLIVKKEVAQYAMKKGLYVIKPKGDSVEICNDKYFNPQTWAVNEA